MESPPETPTPTADKPAAAEAPDSWDAEPEAKEEEVKDEWDASSSSEDEATDKAPEATATPAAAIEGMCWCLYQTNDTRRLIG